MNVILGKSPTGRLTVETGRYCSLKLFAAGSHLHSGIAASAADKFRVGRDPSQACPAAIGSAVLNASVLGAMNRVN